MKVSETCPLFLTDLHLYDFEACYWNILKRMDYDLDNIPFENKKERNIAIGKLQSQDPRLAQHLYKVAEDLVSEFIYRNELNEEDIVVRQRDGLITKKRLEETTLPSGIEFKKRASLSFIIIARDRRKFLYRDQDGKIVVKGVPFLYDEMRQYFQRFSSLNFLSKRTLCSQLQSLRDDLEKQSVATFCIPNEDESVSIFLIGEGQIVLSKRSIRLISKKNIDFNRYFDHYFRPFTESLFIELIRRK